MSDGTPNGPEGVGGFVDQDGSGYEPPVEGVNPYETHNPSTGASGKRGKFAEVTTGWKPVDKPGRLQSLSPFRYLILGIGLGMVGLALAMFTWVSFTAMPDLPVTAETRQQESFSVDGELIDPASGAIWIDPSNLYHVVVNPPEFLKDMQVQAVDANKCIKFTGDISDGVDQGEANVWSVDNAGGYSLFCNIDDWIPYMHDRIPHTHHFLWLDIYHGPAGGKAE